MLGRPEELDRALYNGSLDVSMEQSRYFLRTVLDGADWSLTVHERVEKRTPRRTGSALQLNMH